MYIKNILKNNNFYNTKKIKKIKYYNKCKQKTKSVSYIMIELKKILKNPIYFIHCIYPSLIFIVSIGIIILRALPNVRTLLATDLMGDINKFNFDLDFICVVLIIIQILFTTSNIAITSISRDGKNAILMKYIPIDLYKQFLYKLVPQFIMNLILIIFVLIIEKIILPKTSLLIMLFIFIIANLLNIINDTLLILVDFVRPNLNWDSDYEAMKGNKNKIFQYVITIFVILLIVYFSNIFSEINIKLACLLIICILTIFIILSNIIIRRSILKIFKKIE